MVDRNVTSIGASEMASVHTATGHDGSAALTQIPRWGRRLCEALRRRSPGHSWVPVGSLRITAHSASSAMAPITWTTSLPVGLAVSIGSESERKCAPAACNRSSMVSKRARQPVDAHHDQHIAAAEATEQLRQFGAATIGAAGLLFDDFAASSRPQGGDLRFQVLAFGGDTRVAVGGHDEPF